MVYLYSWVDFDDAFFRYSLHRLEVDRNFQLWLSCYPGRCYSVHYTNDMYKISVWMSQLELGELFDIMRCIFDEHNKTVVYKLYEAVTASPPLAATLSTIHFAYTTREYEGVLYLPPFYKTQPRVVLYKALEKVSAP